MCVLLAVVVILRSPRGMLSPSCGLILWLFSCGLLRHRSSHTYTGLAVSISTSRCLQTHFPRSPYSQLLIWPSYPSPTSPQLCSAALCVPTIAVAPFPQQPVPEALTCPAAVSAPATSPSLLLPHLAQLVPPLVTPVPTIHVSTVPSPTEHPCLPADTPVQVPGMDRTAPKRISADSLCLLHRESYCIDISYFLLSLSVWEA